MSAADVSTAHGPAGSPTHGHDDHHDHPDHVAHHFETAEQQFDSGKLGMWLFLTQEILFFSGLFCAYIIFRSFHPEVFIWAHQFLDKSLGAFNTLVLLFSSFTMAWAVRNAQLAQHRLLYINLVITLACAMLFLGVKTVEYSHKWDTGLLWAGAYAPTGEHHEGDAAAGGEEELVVVTGEDAGSPGRVANGPSDTPASPLQAIADHDTGEPLDDASGGHDIVHEEHSKLSTSLMVLAAPGLIVLIGSILVMLAGLVIRDPNWRVVAPFGLGLTIMSVFFFVGIGCGFVVPAVTEAVFGKAEHGGTKSAYLASKAERYLPNIIGSEVADGLLDRDGLLGSPNASQRGMMDPSAGPGTTATAIPGGPVVTAPAGVDQGPRGAGQFFSIYYCMTGVHAIHIIAGIIVIAWVMWKGLRREFHDEYFGPVDNVGLYWHLVDLVWIYLFPLLYLIH